MSWHYSQEGGGGILASRLLGWHTRCAVEINPYARRILLARQRDGMLERFPIWDDIRTFDGKQWRGSIDVVSGGFPCQDISAAGKGEGITGAKSSLWFEMARVIREVEPKYVFVENSPMLVSRGLDVVLGSLASLGFNARWGVLGAHHAGAPHKRDRLWIVATHPYREVLRQQSKCELGSESTSVTRHNGEQESMADANSARQPQSEGSIEEFRGWPGDVRQDVAYTDCAQCQGDLRTIGIRETHTDTNGAGWWQTEPDVGRVADGVAARVDRLTALGNGQVSILARIAWEVLSK